MRTYSMMERWPGKALFAALLFGLLMLARDTLVTSCLVGFEKSQFLGAGILAAFGVVFLAANRRRIKEILLDKRVAAMAATGFLFLIPMLAKRDWQMMYFSILFCPLVAVFFSFFTDVRETSRYYLVILAVLSVHSLISLYILRALLIMGKISATGFANSNGWYFYNFGLSFPLSWEYWYRNFGIFREPGVYQFFLLLGLYLNNYKADWKRPLVCWGINAILAVTMVSTFAIGGLLEMALFAVFLYVDKKWYRTSTGKWLGIAAAVVGVAAVGFVIYKVRQPGAEATFWFYFLDLYLRLFNGSNSLVDRLDAIAVDAQLFFANPVFGNTIANVLHGTNHNTSSTLILYAVLGVLGGSLNVAAWVALAWEKRRGIVANLILLMILFMSFNTQNLVADVFFWLFPYMALMERVLPKLPGKKA